MRHLLIFALASGLCTEAAVITSGFISITGQLPIGAFTLNSSTFTASGGFSNGNWAATLCLVCAPGDPAGADGTVVNNDFGPGSAVVNGNPFPALGFGSLLAPQASIFTITTPAFAAPGVGVHNGTFTFTGQLCGDDGGVDCVVLLPNLTGSGTFVVTYGPSGLNDGTATFQRAIYTFATPEPSAGMLLAGGLGLLGLLLRRRRAVERR